MLALWVQDVSIGVSHCPRLMQLQRVSRTCTCKPRPESGLDCLMRVPYCLIKYAPVMQVCASGGRDVVLTHLASASHATLAPPLS